MASATVRHSTQPITSRRQVVERVEAFLRAHIGEPVSIAQLCQVAGVSERSLRNAFYDVRGMSPKRCAVRARLAEVRRALSLANGARGAVTTIATDYGFFELGRFASTYKAVFGESPSATLRGRGTARGAMTSTDTRACDPRRRSLRPPRVIGTRATNRRAATGIRGHGQLAANQVDALAHAGEPQPVPTGRAVASNPRPESAIVNRSRAVCR